jgi:hypothetical protein
MSLLNSFKSFFQINIILFNSFLHFSLIGLIASTLRKGFMEDSFMETFFIFNWNIHLYLMFAQVFGKIKIVESRKYHFPNILLEYLFCLLIKYCIYSHYNFYKIPFTPT